LAAEPSSGQALTRAQKMILIDSNIIIYAVSGKFPAVTDWLSEQNFAVSAISVLEVLGYHKLKAREKTELEILFSQLTVDAPAKSQSMKMLAF
jgi:predicted nucleic acid-binding protein